MEKGEKGRPLRAQSYITGKQVLTEFLSMWVKKSRRGKGGKGIRYQQQSEKGGVSLPLYLYIKQARAERKKTHRRKGTDLIITV